MTDTRTIDMVAPMAPYMPEFNIEIAAWHLLLEAYGEAPIHPPIPVEELAECYCKIPLEFEEMDPNILGYFEFGQKKIWINSCLESREDERFRFTLAHELGHYKLHARYAKDGGVLYSKGAEFYRNNYSRLERQANLFAGDLLMPRTLVAQEWLRITGSEEPYALENDKKNNDKMNPVGSDFIDLNGRTSFDFMPEIAETFQVSYTCASIQLKKLGFLY